MAKILIVEDDFTLSMVLKAWLEKQGHTVDVVSDGHLGLDRLTNYPHDAAIVDWDLPTLTGPDLCDQYRRTGGTVPVLILTGKDGTRDKAMGLDSGADDYLTKPFELEELGARVRALLRRAPNIKPSVLSVADIELDSTNRVLTKAGKAVHLVPKEFALLEFLMRHPNQVFSSEALLNRIWSSEAELTPETIRPYITRLRSKLDSPDLIKTVHGVGYMLVSE